jgi:hypothetical protein
MVSGPVPTPRGPFESGVLPDTLGRSRRARGEERHKNSVKYSHLMKRIGFVGRPGAVAAVLMGRAPGPAIPTGSSSCCCATAGASRGVWSVLRVPSAAAEDARRLCRELQRLIQHRAPDRISELLLHKVGKPNGRARWGRSRSLGGRMFRLRKFRNRRELAAASGFVGNSCAAGQRAHAEDQQSGQPQARWLLVGFAFNWMRCQPASALSCKSHALPNPGENTYTGNLD